MSVSGADVSRFYNTLPNNPCYNSNGFGASQLLYDYLITDLKNRINPTVTIGGYGKFDLHAIFESNLELGIEHNLNGVVRSYYESDHVHQVANKLNDAKNEWNIYAVDYGTALALGF
jgi:hypothetical protein